MKYSNGDVYNGGFEYDLCSKNGKMTYKDGSVYEGLWSNGLVRIIFVLETYGILIPFKFKIRLEIVNLKKLEKGLALFGG